MKEGEKLIYKNLLEAMKKENVTFKQIGNLLDCRYQTVSDIVNGVTKKGFYYDDAINIQRVLFPTYSTEYLFQRDKVS